jgi:ribulose-bisphosphate carboxylase large chain
MRSDEASEGRQASERTSLFRPLFFEDTHSFSQPESKILIPENPEAETETMGLGAATKKPKIEGGLAAVATHREVPSSSPPKKTSTLTSGDCYPPNVLHTPAQALLRDKVKRENQATKKSNPHPDSSQHPERFWVDYVMEAGSAEAARKLAWELCLEQTVELPEQTEVVQQVLPFVVGSVERIEAIEQNHSYRVSVAYPNDTAGNELTQFINVVFGNTSLKPGVAVENVVLSHHLSEDTTMFPGPRYGIQGVRDLLGIPQAPLLCTALKPMGKSSAEFASMAYQLAHGGIDIIKDDHGLADQVWAPFEERVTLCAEAIQRANRETGKKCLYAPCLNAPASLIRERAYFAKTAGAGAVMLLPGISGFDIVRELAADSHFGLPIIIHPAMLGGWIQPSSQSSTCRHPRGLSHEFLFGVLPRLCGGDAVIFPNAGGRFQYSKDECQAIAEGCRRPMGRFAPILPSPAGGMKLHRVEEMRQTFGDDTLFLIGGALFEEGPDLEADAQAFCHCAGRDRPYIRPTSMHLATDPPKSTPRGKSPATNEKRKAAELSDVAGDEEMTLVLEERLSLPSGAAFVGPYHQIVSGLDEFKNKSNETKVLRFRPQNFRWEVYYEDAKYKPTTTNAPPAVAFHGVSRVELIGERDESAPQHTRYFECAPGGYTTLERHEHEHTIVILRGQGEARLGCETVPLSFGDVIYVAPNQAHQLRCADHATEPFGFLCVVPATRDKDKPLTPVDARQLVQHTSHNQKPDVDALLGGSK